MVTLPCGIYRLAQGEADHLTVDGRRIEAWATAADTNPTETAVRVPVDTPCDTHLRSRASGPEGCTTGAGILPHMDLTTLPDEVKELVRAQIQAGRFQSVDEVVVEALRLLQEREELFASTATSCGRRSRRASGRKSEASSETAVRPSLRCVAGSTSASAAESDPSIRARRSAGRREGQHWCASAMAGSNSSVIRRTRTKETT